MRSPSKYMSLNQLIEIRDNNYISRVHNGIGQEYVSEEVDALIYEKLEKKHEREYEDAISRYNTSPDNSNDNTD